MIIVIRSYFVGGKAHKELAKYYSKHNGKKENRKGRRLLERMEKYYVEKLTDIDK